MEIKKQRLFMEKLHFNDAKKIVDAVGQLRLTRDSMEKWENQVDTFRSGEKLLYDQKYNFPSKWKDFEEDYQENLG